MDGHKDNGDSSITSLDDLCKDGRAAQNLFNMKLASAKLEEPAYHECLERLQSYGDEFPTLLKFSILEKHLSDTFKKESEECIISYLALIAPWQTKDNLVGSFDPKAPRLLTIEGSPATQAVYWQNKVISLVCTLVRKDKEGEALLCKTLLAILTSLDSRMDVDEASADEEGAAEDIDEIVDPIDQAIDCVSDCVKAIRLLSHMESSNLTVASLQSGASLTEILEARHARGQQASSNPYHVVSTEIFKSTFWSGKASVAKTQMIHYKMWLPKLEKASRDLDTAGTAEDGVVPPCYEEWMSEVVVPARAVLPACHLTVFENALATRVKAVLTNGIKVCKDTAAGNGAVDILQCTKSLRSLLASAEKKFPGASEWNPFCKDLDTLHSSRLKESATDEAASIAKDYAERSVEDIIASQDDPADDWCLKVRAMQVSIATKFEQPAEALRAHSALLMDLFIKFTEVHMKYSENGQTSQERLDQSLSVLLGFRSFWSCEKMSEPYEKAVNMLEAVSQLNASMCALAKLDEDVDKRASHASAGDCLRTLHSAHAQALEKLTKVEGRLKTHAEARCNEVKNVLDEIKPTFLGIKKALVKSLQSACSSQLVDAVWPMEEAAETSWDSFVVASEVWRTYKQGDQLRSNQAKLNLALTDFKAASEMFGFDDDSATYKTGMEVNDKVESLVFAVKVCQTLIKPAGSAAKAKRFASTTLTKLNTDKHATFKLYMPKSLLARLEADKLA